ncbi:MAG: suppressor of fused domain protein [Clostridiales bacterium]|nr:suppressor of fused domain protein [Clostridiales bacterium]
MGLFGIGKGKKKGQGQGKGGSLPEVYDEADVEALDAHITKYFGASEKVFHEIVSPDIHLDVYICDPTEERPYYTLVTHGAGAHRMNLPDEVEGQLPDRAEVLITLPKDWDINSSDENWYWPIRSLKDCARLPITYDTWIGYGHTVTSPEREPYGGSGFTGLMITFPLMFEPESFTCNLPGGNNVVFYQIMPLYGDEMDYKLENDAEALEDLFGDDIPFVLDINRKSIISG